jgi:hypothetical protein
MSAREFGNWQPARAVSSVKCPRLQCGEQTTRTSRGCRGSGGSVRGCSDHTPNHKRERCKGTGEQAKAGFAQQDQLSMGDETKANEEIELPSTTKVD